MAFDDIEFDLEGIENVDLDADLGNADWTKRTWDLPVDSVEQMRAYLKLHEISVDDFKTTPLYRHHVDKIDWLKYL